MRFEPRSWWLQSFGFLSCCRVYLFQHWQKLFWKWCGYASSVWSLVRVREAKCWIRIRGLELWACSWKVNLEWLIKPLWALVFPSGKYGCRWRNSKGTFSLGSWNLCCISWVGSSSYHASPEMQPEKSMAGIRGGHRANWMCYWQEDPQSCLPAEISAHCLVAPLHKVKGNKKN